MIESLYATRSADEPDLTNRESADELVSRARALRPLLRERHAEHEAIGGYAEDVHRAFAEAGFYKVLIPKKYGGLELGLDAFTRLGIEISRGDPAVGWAFILGAGHAFHVGSFFGSRAQSELFGEGEFISPSRTVPSGRAEKIEGGWRLNGTWDYCSGSMWSTHALVVSPSFDESGTMVGMRMHALRREQFEILDDWGGGRTIGMAASASNSIRVQDEFVPEHLSIMYEFREHVLGESGPLGFQDHPAPAYVGRTMLYFNAELVATQVGAAWACLDEYGELMRARKASFPPRGDRVDTPEYHRWYGKMLALIDSAEALLLAGVRQYAELAQLWMQTGVEFTPEQDARLRAIVQQGARLAGDAIELAFTTAGSSAAKAGSPIQKYYRDAAMYKTHIAAQWDVTYSAASRYLFGQPLVF